MADMSTTAAVDKDKMGEGEASKKPKGTIALYFREIERYNRAVSDWHQEGEEIEKVYLDETRNKSSTVRKFSLMWANVEVLKPAVYAKLPIVMCSRRHRDKDVVGRVAAEIMERATNTSFDLYNVDEVFKLVRDDRLIPGRGTAWVRYEPTIESYDDPDGTLDNETGEVVQYERVAGEKACVDYVHWKDFGHNIGRNWSQDTWLVWRIVYKTHDEAVERFGKEVAGKLTYSHKAPAQGSGSDTDAPDERAKIYEVWDKRRKQTAWIAEGYKDYLDCGEPPLSFMNFFPCPEPAYATKGSKNMIPVPDYRYYRDQAKEINDLTEKIHNMSQWLIIKGFVPGGPSSVSDSIEEMLQDKTNKEMFYQVESMAEWSDRGGIQKMIDWFPVEQVVKALQGAILVRKELIQDVYQLIGISDILRGQSDPNETLGAQELKAQTGSKRLRNTKDEIARFCRDVARLVAEVIADQFSPQTIADITGYKYIPPAPPQMRLINPQMGIAGPRPPMPGMQAMGGNGGPPMQQGQPSSESNMTFDDNVMKLLRDDRLRSFKIDIETDSTVQADENMEKQQRMEFLTAFGGFMEQVVTVTQAAPDMGQAMAEASLFLVRGFRAGRALEDAIESGMQASLKRAKQMMENPPVDPQVQIEQERLKMEAQNAQVEHQIDAQAQQQKTQLDIQSQQTQAQLAREKQNGDFKLAIRKQNLDAAIKKEHNKITASAQVRDRAASKLQ